MTKIITYKCNTCSTEFSSKQAVEEKLVLAIYFTGNDMFELRNLPQDCDHHICKSCTMNMAHNFKGEKTFK